VLCCSNSKGLPMLPKDGLPRRLAMTAFMLLRAERTYGSTENEAGFSLLELAIVLVIIGIIGGITLPLLTAQMKRAAFVKTKTHQEYALQAIGAYVEKYKRFPCPADPLITGPQHGIARLHCQGESARGILPFKTLGISEIYAKDGHKHLIVYAVEPNLTKRDADLPHEPGGYITVKNTEGHSVLASPKKNDPHPNYVALVLLSHGEGCPLPDNTFIFHDNPQTGTLLRWESRDVFLKQYVKF
jgi:prepilin-type N-terminal cleavage/methylation domain-containing protein